MAVEWTATPYRCRRREAAPVLRSVHALSEPTGTTVRTSSIDQRSLRACVRRWSTDGRLRSASSSVASLLHVSSCAGPGRATAFGFESGTPPTCVALLCPPPPRPFASSRMLRRRGCVIVAVLRERSAGRTDVLRRRSAVPSRPRGQTRSAFSPETGSRAQRHSARADLPSSLRVRHSARRRRAVTRCRAVARGGFHHRTRPPRPDSVRICQTRHGVAALCPCE